MLCTIWPEGNSCITQFFCYKCTPSSWLALSMRSCMPCLVCSTMQRLAQTCRHSTHTMYAAPVNLFAAEPVSSHKHVSRYMHDLYDDLQVLKQSNLLLNCGQSICSFTTLLPCISIMCPSSPGNASPVFCSPGDVSSSPAAPHDLARPQLWS